MDETSADHLRAVFRAGIGGHPMPVQPADPAVAERHRERSVIHARLAGLYDHLAELDEAGRCPNLHTLLHTLRGQVSHQSSRSKGS